MKELKDRKRLGLECSKSKRVDQRRGRGVTRVISFTSGKGGVGKTNSVVNVAIALGQQGKNVLLLDADFGLANVNVLLGLQPRLTLHDVLSGKAILEEIMLDGPAGISIIPAASGIESICCLSDQQRYGLMEAIEEIAYDFDYLLIDTQAGIGPEVLHFNSASSEIVCVICNEPTSLTDAYALIKVMATHYGEKSISILANNVADQQAGVLAFKRLASVVDRFLHIDLNYLGSVPGDSAVSLAVSEQRAILELYPSSPAGLALSGLARKIDADYQDYKIKGGMQFFFRQLLEADVNGP